MPKFSCSVQLYWISISRSKNFVWDITLGHLNISSPRSKIEAVEEQINICFLPETKVDETFLKQQVNISNNKILGRGRNKHSGGLSFYISENILCKVINYDKIPN